MKDSSFSVIDLILFALAVSVCVCILTIARPCGLHEEGIFGPCHEAGMVVLVLGGVLSFQAFILVLSSSHSAKIALSLAMLPLGLAIALMPDFIMPLCVEPEMRCQAIMQPVIMVLGGACGFFSLIGAFRHYRMNKKLRKDNEK